MPFSVELGPQSYKFVSKLDNQIKERIKNNMLPPSEIVFHIILRKTEFFKLESDSQLEIPSTSQDFFLLQKATLRL